TRRRRRRTGEPHHTSSSGRRRSSSRAERRTGELLRETANGHQRQIKGRPEKLSSRDDISLKKLTDLGISRDQSSDWQKLAAIPEPEFEQRLARAAEDSCAEP